MDRLTQHDLRNIRFLMSLGKIGLMRFMQQASEDDIKYANEIMHLYRQELLKEEERHSRLSEDMFLSLAENEIEDFSDAKLVLNKFMLNK
jgi:hypothetical protein